MTCKEPDCLREVFAKGCCSTHYQAYRRRMEKATLSLSPLPHLALATRRLIPIYPATCSIEGCGLKHRNRGFCRMHHERYRKHGDPLKVLPRGYPAGRYKKCAMGACDRNSRALGLCDKHYRQSIKRKQDKAA